MIFELWTLDEIAGWPYDEDDNPAVVTERDCDEWAAHAADLTEMDEFDLDEFFANACCPDSLSAARSWCDCGGSAQLPSWVRRTREEVMA